MALRIRRSRISRYVSGATDGLRWRCWRRRRRFAAFPAPTGGKKASTSKNTLGHRRSENRSFDNLFATFPGADGTTVGRAQRQASSAGNGSQLSLGNESRLPAVDQRIRRRKDGWLRSCSARNRGYEYVEPADSPYWKLAQEYVLLDNTFQTQGSGSFTAHQDLIRGGTEIGDAAASSTFQRSRRGAATLPRSTSSLITADNLYLAEQGPRPCLTYRTLRTSSTLRRSPAVLYAKHRDAARRAMECI